MTDNISVLDIKPKGATTKIIVWLHGLGASANDFEPVLPIINEHVTGVRYLFPNAPLKSVSVNGGMTMPAWYDIVSPDLAQHQDNQGISASCDKLEAIVSQIREESGSEIPVILAGFSQGGVIALGTALTRNVNVQGVLALSTYLPDIAEQNSANNNNLTLLMMHGTQDPVVPHEYARQSFNTINKTITDARWMEYPMEHSLCYEQVVEIGKWLKDTF